MSARETIVDAALELLDEGGIAAVGARSIGRRAHYHRSTVMYHIGSIGQLRDDLWCHVGLEVLESAFPDHRVDAADEGWLDGVAAGLVAYWGDHRERMEFFVGGQFHIHDSELCAEVVGRLYPDTDPTQAVLVAQLSFGMLAAVIDILDDLPEARREAAVRMMCETVARHVELTFPALAS